LNPLKLSSKDLPGFTREHIQYDIEKGVTTDGYLLIPKSNQQHLPGLVVFHATTEFGARAPAGLAPDYPRDHRQGVQFAEKGFIVGAPATT